MNTFKILILEPLSSQYKNDWIEIFNFRNEHSKDDGVGIDKEIKQEIEIMLKIYIKGMQGFLGIVDWGQR